MKRKELELGELEKQTKKEKKKQKQEEFSVALDEIWMSTVSKELREDAENAPAPSSMEILNGLNSSSKLEEVLIESFSPNQMQTVLAALKKQIFNIVPKKDASSWPLTKILKNKKLTLPVVRNQLVNFSWRYFVNSNILLLFRLTLLKSN